MSLLLLLKPNGQVDPLAKPRRKPHGKDEWAYYGLVIRSHRPGRKYLP
jgi:hypothetical protein